MGVGRGLGGGMNVMRQGGWGKEVVVWYGERGIYRNRTNAAMARGVCLIKATVQNKKYGSPVHSRTHRADGLVPTKPRLAKWFRAYVTPTVGYPSPY